MALVHEQLYKSEYFSRSNFQDYTQALITHLSSYFERTANFRVSVADNGVGLPVDLDWTNTDTMGLLLVKMFGQHQLQGRTELDRSCGTSFRLRFEPKTKDE